MLEKILISIVLVISVSACANTYIVKCYNKSDKLVYYKEQNHLLRMYDTSAYKRCTFEKKDNNNESN